MLSTLKSYLWGAVAAVMALLSIAVWYLAGKVDRAERRATEAQERAEGERAARQHVEDVTEATREVREDNNRLTIDERRQRLRDKDAIGPRDSE